MGKFIKVYRKYQSNDGGNTWIPTNDYEYEDVNDVDACDCNSYVVYTDDSTSSMTVTHTTKDPANVITVNTVKDARNTYTSLWSINASGIQIYIYDIDDFEDQEYEIESGDVISINDYNGRWCPSNPQGTIQPISSFTYNNWNTVYVKNMAADLQDYYVTANEPIPLLFVPNGSYDTNAQLSPYDVKTAILGNCCTSIDASAFYRDDYHGYNYDLERVTATDSITNLGVGAFYMCGSLISVELPKDTQITSIPFACCYNAYNLRKFSIPSGVTSIGDYAFCYDRNLYGLDLSRITSIGQYAFNLNLKLDRVYCPNLTSLGKNAFEDCSGLTYANIGHVSSIPSKAFSLCTKLSTVEGLENATQIGDYAFDGCPLTSITLSNNLTTIGEKAFARAHVTDLTIPSGITTLGNEAFDDMLELKNLTINGGSITKNIVDCPNIETLVLNNGNITNFQDLQNLESITINGGTVSGYSTFSGCTSLSSVTINGGTVNDSFYQPFHGCTSLTSITVNGGTVGNLGGENVSTIHFENCVISGNQYNSLSYLTFGENVTIESNDAFSYSQITSLNFPSGVLGYESFAYCSNLSSVVIGSGVTILPQGVFNHCTNLTSVTLPDTIERIERYAFGDTTSLTEINYLGTKAQWNAMYRNYDWNYGARNKVIHCSDGDI